MLLSGMAGFPSPIGRLCNSLSDLAQVALYYYFLCMTATTYDPKILQACADSLYRQARWIIITTAVKYGALAFVLFWIVIGLRSQVAHENENTLLLLSLLLTGIAIYLGVSAGRTKAFALKLQAQQVLCQMRIEENTQRTTAAKAGI